MSLWEQVEDAFVVLLGLDMLALAISLVYPQIYSPIFGSPSFVTSASYGAVWLGIFLLLLGMGEEKPSKKKCCCK